MTKYHQKAFRHRICSKKWLILWKINILIFNMIRISKIILAISLVAMVSWSCAKEGTPWFRGSYSFKTSGRVCVNEKDNPDAVAEWHDVQTESGQMHIVEVDRKSGKMKVTMNALAGDAIVFDAVADGGSLVLSPVSRNISVSYGSSEIITVRASVEVSGTGVRYGDMLIIDLEYKGGYKSLDGKEYEIVETDASCVAELND